MFRLVRLFLGMGRSQKFMFLRKLISRLKTVTFYRVLFKRIGSKSFIIRPLFITPEFIFLGDKVKVWHDARIEGIDRYAQKEFDPELVIEDGVEIQQRVHITFAGLLKIGANTSILPDVLITDIDHSYRAIETPGGEQDIICKKTSLGKNCSIGAGSKLLAGTILGDNCIVGANSLVKGHYPNGCVLAGSPARIVKQYNYNSLQWE